jgi:hypothetical protein
MEIKQVNNIKYENKKTYNNPPDLFIHRKRILFLVVG